MAGWAAMLIAVQITEEVVPARPQMGLKRHDETAMRLARHWSQATGVLVARGAGTGTVVSFGMLLWPGSVRSGAATYGTALW